jgi:hypothetical protein
MPKDYESQITTIIKNIQFENQNFIFLIVNISNLDADRIHFPQIYNCFPQAHLFINKEHLVHCSGTRTNDYVYDDEGTKLKYRNALIIPIEEYYQKLIN